ncbi:serine/threonine-protein kinase [Paractinoplanes hotanensis]|uniref:Serine/threonine protein kinase n=1 Tax=Paractinoplanes hotanensis TaxID=2906497 RepID=A0ABT0YCK7_9ACTN|nr:serine/threonine-protein kinase [Actinoplanes hotanensis]MCM4083791.1 serine/threonine protein kinase [Actinoplanes hotanensis]
MTQHGTRDRLSVGSRADTHGTSTMDLSGRCVGSSYVLQRPIGQGATGTVWEALDRATGEPVAVKLLHESLLRQPRLVTRFVQERTILRMLRHRNVVRVHDLFSVGETIGLVMDLVSGGSLRDLLRTRPTVAVGEAARLTAQVAAALAEAHDLGVVHRDLKPDNILLATTDGRLDTRLTDFGVARILNTPSMTTPNAVVGTPHYMSPEAFHGATASPATDVYALGVLLYELVSGRPPYLSDSIPDLMRQHLEGNPARRSGLPDPVWDVIMACMAQKPRLRPTAAELVADLSDVARRFAGTPALPTPPDALSEPPRSAPVLHSASLSSADDSWLVSPTADRAARSGRAASSGLAVPAARAEPVSHPAPSLVPPQRHPGKRNAVPGWRWARPGATMALVAATMVASAVATTAWNMGRDDGETKDLAAPRVIVETAPSAAAPAPSTVAQRRTDVSANRNAGRTPTGSTRPLPAVGTPPAPAPAAPTVRPKAAQKPTKRPPARSPHPEAQPYGPWQCNQSFAIDFRTKTAARVQPCHMLGRDVRYQASVTAPGGGRGRIAVALKDATTGRVVGATRTCDDLTFEGDAATRTCGPSAASPPRGHSYAVVMSFSYDRDGRTLNSEAKSATFTW